MHDVIIDAPPEARVYVRPFMTGKHYLASLLSSPVADLADQREKRVALRGDRKNGCARHEDETVNGIMVGLAGQELDLEADSVGGLPVRQALAKREHEIAAEGGRPIYYRPDGVDQETFSQMFTDAANGVLADTGSAFQFDYGEIGAKPLRGHGYVALATDGSVPPDIADMVKSQLFQDHMAERLGHFRSVELARESFERLRREAPDLGVVREALRSKAHDLRESFEALHGTDFSAARDADRQLADDMRRARAREAAADAKVEAETGVKPKPKTRAKRGMATAQFSELELPRGHKRVLNEVERRQKVVNGMFANALEDGLRIATKAKVLTRSDLLAEEGKGTIAMVSERLARTPRAELDLLYHRTRELSRSGFGKPRDDGAQIALGMLKAEYRLRGLQPDPQPKVLDRFKEKFGKLLGRPDERTARLEDAVVQERMVRERVANGDISMLRFDPKSEDQVRRAVRTWSRGMNKEAQANFADALSKRGVPDKLVAEGLNVEPKHAVYPELAAAQEAMAQAVAARAKAAGR